MIGAAAASLVAVLATTSAALAATGSASDQNLRYTRAYVERAYDMLSHDQSAYGGHRVAAMNDLTMARNDLTQALHFDRNPEDASIPAGVRPEDTDLVNFVRGQHASNQNLAFVRSYLDHAIDMLQRDAHDYGGFRLKAIASLSDARDHYERGMAHYQLGEFPQAIDEFKIAYAASRAPGLLFNMAQASRLCNTTSTITPVTARRRSTISSKRRPTLQQPFATTRITQTKSCRRS